MLLSMITNIALTLFVEEHIFMFISDEMLFICFSMVMGGWIPLCLCFVIILSVEPFG